MIRVRTTCLNLIDSLPINIYLKSVKNRFQVFINVSLRTSAFIINLLLHLIFYKFYNPYPDGRYVLMYNHNWYDNLD